MFLSLRRLYIVFAAITCILLLIEGHEEGHIDNEGHVDNEGRDLSSDRHFSNATIRIGKDPYNYM